MIAPFGQLSIETRTKWGKNPASEGKLVKCRKYKSEMKVEAARKKKCEKVFAKCYFGKLFEFYFFYYVAHFHSSFILAKREMGIQKQKIYTEKNRTVFVS